MSRRVDDGCIQDDQDDKEKLASIDQALLRFANNKEGSI